MFCEKSGNASAGPSFLLTPAAAVACVLPCFPRKVIREDFTIEAYDILELHCELVAERMRLVASKKEVPPDMEQAVCTIIWAADRAEVSQCPRCRTKSEPTI